MITVSMETSLQPVIVLPTDAEQLHLSTPDIRDQLRASPHLQQPHSKPR